MLNLARRRLFALLGGVAACSVRAADLSANARMSRALRDMQLLHEVIPLGVAPDVGWKRRPEIGANTDPYGSAIPSYWKGKRFAEWRAMVPWFVIYAGEPQNAATNVQVEVSGLECWVLLESSRRWILCGASERPKWDSIYAPNAIDRLSATASGLSHEAGIRYTPRPLGIIHGGLGQLPVPWNDRRADIRALYASVRHRLTVKDSQQADDRDVANLGLQVGIDYYPWVGAKLEDLGASYVPAAGLGRFIAVRPDWRYSSVILRGRGVTVEDLLQAPLPAFLY